MTTRRSSLLACTAVATLNFATIACATAQAGDLIPFAFSKFCPNSIRSKIETHLTRVSSAKPKDKEIASAQASSHVAAAPGNRAAVAGSTVSTPAVSAGNACLTKQYLATGAVLFEDVCTKDRAINSTSVASRRAASPNCLTRDSGENGVVMFRDTCTDEWAMNMSQQQNRADPLP
jgi:hypothetical protein